MESKIEKILHELMDMRRDVITRNSSLYSVKDYVFLISFELYVYLVGNIKTYDISLSVDRRGSLRIFGQEVVLVDISEDEVYFTKKRKVSKVKVKEIISFEIEAYKEEDIEELTACIAGHSDEKTRIRNIEREVI